MDQRSTPTIDTDILDQLQRTLGAEAFGVVTQAFDLEIKSSRAALSNALEAEDWNALETVSHALKSAAASVGAMQVSGVCLAIEEAARARAGTLVFHSLLGELAAAVCTLDEEKPW